MCDKFEMKKCCKECGFPEGPREPMFLSNNIFSVVCYEAYKCETCGHQRDGSTILAVSEGLRWRRKLWDNRKKEEIKKACEEERERIFSYLHEKFSDKQFLEIVAELAKA